MKTLELDMHEEYINLLGMLIALTNYENIQPESIFELVRGSLYRMQNIIDSHVIKSIDETNEKDKNPKYWN